VLCGLWVDAHAANRIDRDCPASGVVSITVLAAAAGLCLRLAAMMMAGVSRAMCVIVIQLRHQNSPAT
jgi:hypothetical protein